jgi:hypothetical protein
MPYLPAIVVVALTLAFIAITLLLDPRWRFGYRLPVTKTAATTALSCLSEWAKWMAGIQTATLGGLVLILKGPPPPPLKGGEAWMAAATTIWLGAALFCSGWVLSAVSSVTLRIDRYPDGVPSEELDIYELPLYGISHPVKLGYVANLQHCFWGAGLIAFAIFLVLHFLK